MKKILSVLFLTAMVLVMAVPVMAETVLSLPEVTIAPGTTYCATRIRTWS